MYPRQTVPIGHQHDRYIIIDNANFRFYRNKGQFHCKMQFDFEGHAAISTEFISIF